MSIRLMSAVWEHADSEGPELLVLLAMADFARDSGECWPAIETIAQKARISERWAREMIRRLEAKGYVATQERPGTSNFYTVNVAMMRDKPDVENQPEGGTGRNRGSEGEGGTGRNQGAGGAEPGFPQTVTEPSCTPTGFDKPTPAQEEQERANQDVDNIHNKKRRTTATITESTAQSTCTPTGFDKPTPAQESFKALAEVCDISLASMTSNQRGALNQSEAILRQKEGATPLDFREFRKWWDDHDWRGARGDPPHPHQVREEWGRFRAWYEDDGLLAGFVDVTRERLERDRERAAQSGS